MAKMINLESLGYRPVCPLVIVAVGTASYSPEAVRAIPILVERLLPYPARSFPAAIFLNIVNFLGVVVMDVVFWLTSGISAINTGKRRDSGQLAAPAEAKTSRVVRFYLVTIRTAVAKCETFVLTFHITGLVRSVCGKQSGPAATAHAFPFRIGRNGRPDGHSRAAMTNTEAGELTFNVAPLRPVTQVFVGG